ncbi:alginate lyase family protein [Paenibacillus qinlingensis]|uniref:CBM6 domain-containing protein n=1 Tax=Paenibacillus qinlingensis TaxID=1837343 RepID=A0ABU1P667_9BACL|nr:alginate lyase family protein [Paenibacillus qinlingensis]MDR6555253.1 hypothetical protein [Paenibacillus qinlingensis]
MMKIRKFTIGLAVALSSMMVFSSAAMAYTHTGGITTEYDIAFTSSKVTANQSPWNSAYTSMLADANAGLLVTSHATATWNIPNAYSDPTGHQAGKLPMEIDAKAAYSTALAYRYTGNTAYANKARDLINSWATTNTNITGSDAPLVTAYLAVGLIKAAEIIKGYSGWSSTDQNQFIAWVTNECLNKWDAIGQRNNWWDWSLYAQLSFYHFTDNSTAFAAEVANLKTQIDTSIDSQGFITDETTRGANAMWYHYFALAPITAAAEIVYNDTGEDLYNWTSPNGKSIKLALDKYFYYVNGHVAEWPYGGTQNFANPMVANKWPVDLFEAMAEVYQDPNYESYVAPYRPITANVNSNSGYYLSYSWMYPTLLKSTTKVEAENYSGQSGIVVAATADVGGGSKVGQTANNDYVYYNNVNFGSGVSNIRFRYATANTNATLELRSGSTTGTLLGSVSLAGTGSWTSYKTATVPVTGASGMKNLYIVFKGGTSVADLNWFTY